MQYQLMMKFKTGDLLSGVRTIENEVNKHMRDFGFSEEMSLESEAPIFTLNTDRELTREEKISLMQTINDHFSKQEIKMVCTAII